METLSSGAGRGDEAGVRSWPLGFDSPRLQPNGWGRSSERPQDDRSGGEIYPQDKAREEGCQGTTHEAFVQAVRSAVTPRVNDKALRARLLGAKLVYGGGPVGVRGICYHGAWANGEAHDFLEVSAIGEESFVQVAGTTIHELAHSLAGPGAGHGPTWKAACATLGLRVAQAGGQEYSPEHFDPAVWTTIEALPHPSDGRPQFGSLGAEPPRPRPCPLGIGTRGGKSRGVGSGSRLRLWVCACPEGTPGRKVRVACDTWDATCNRCRTRYLRPEA